MGDSADKKGACAVCNSPATSSCSGCRNVFYCGKQHQKKHWKQHKPVCSPYKIAESSELGRHLVATRNLKPGELILSDPALVMGPKQYSEPCCLGCMKPLSEVVGATHRCQCGFPLCSRRCAGSEAHRPECEAVRSSGRHLEVDLTVSPNPHYQAVTALRCLALRGSTERWRQLQQLQAHDQERRISGRQAELDDHVYEFLTYINFPVERQEVYNVCGVLDVNGFELPTRSAIGLYPRAAMIEHNCAPNTTRTFTDSLAVAVRASVPISKGEHITTSYTDPLWGTDNRRYFLRQSKFFDCVCRRCADPTELGSELSTLLCPDCDEGHVRCLQPLETDSWWQCDSCPRRLRAKEVEEIIQHVGEKLVTVEKGSTQAAEQFIKMFSHILGPHHFYICDIKTALCLLYGKDAEQGETTILSYQEAERKEELATELLEVLGKVNPGQSRLRGVLLYELQTAVLRKAQIGVESGSVDSAHWRQTAQTCMEYLQEASEVLLREPECSSERHLAEQASRELEALTKVLAVTGMQAVMSGAC